MTDGHQRGDMDPATLRAALSEELDSMELTFTARGVRREDGKTAAQVEAEQREASDGSE